MKTSQHLIQTLIILIVFVVQINGQTNITTINNKPAFLDSVLDINNIELFPIYGLDNIGINKVIRFYLPIEKTLPLKEKIKLIIYNLSGYCFRGLPIELINFTDSNNLIIAHINLKEDHYYLNNNDITWKTLYFQGLNGGLYTTTTLIESCLQRKYKSNWIDAVMFYYENKPININDWDHIQLSGIVRR